MQCPSCDGELPGSFGLFDEGDRVPRGKNERCPKCGAVLWIPYPWGTARGRTVSLGILSPQLVGFSGGGVDDPMFSRWRERTRI